MAFRGRTQSPTNKQNEGESLIKTYKTRLHKFNIHFRMNISDRKHNKIHK